MTDPSAIRLHTVEAGSLGFPVEIGDMVSVAVVEASNVYRDALEFLRNILGGRMRRYEGLFERLLERGEEQFRKALAERGYDGAVMVRYAHPNVVAGGAELIIYGTGYRRISARATQR